MEIDYQKLKELGITNNGKKKQFCPECHANRTDKRDKSLSVDWDKCIAHCHYCGKNFFFGKTEKIGYAPKVAYQQPKTEMKGYKKPAKLTNKEPLDENMRQWFANRGIPAEVAESEGISKVCRKMPQTEKVEMCIVFPYRVNGQLVNRKFRHLGQLGIASFQYNTCCGRFVPMQESKTPDIPDEDPKWDNSNWLAKKLPIQGELNL